VKPRFFIEHSVLFFERGALGTTDEERTVRDRFADLHQRIDIFCCYSRKDRPFLLQLRAHLALLERLGRIRFWADIDIEAGGEWEKEIHSHLETAQIILLLISSDFIESDSCYGAEMHRALERQRSGEARVIPILLRPVDWQDAPFGTLQALPRDGRPITDWPSQEHALRDIAKDIRTIVSSLTGKTKASVYPHSVVEYPYPLDGMPPTRARYWRENEWFKIRLPTILLLVDLLILMLLPADAQRPANSQVLSLQDIPLNGWLFMRASLPGGPGVLVILNLHTGQTRALQARSSMLQQTIANLGLTNYNDPLYTTRTHQLAFIATDMYGKRGIWSVPLLLQDGWPVMSRLPNALVDPCETNCENSLTWSADGNWLIFTGRKGIEATHISTHTTKYLTSHNDRWPACSPDGQWLAYQGAQDVVQALPASNCMPLAQAYASVRFINSFSLSWFPLWSPDGKNLVFKSDSKPGWVLYEIAFQEMSASTMLPSVPPTPVGEANCSTMTWAQFQPSGHNVQIFACSDQAHSASHVLIEPDSAPPAWQVVVPAGNYAWNSLNWTPVL
jgi:hypothetical protein